MSNSEVAAVGGAATNPGSEGHLVGAGTWTEGQHNSAGARAKETQPALRPCPRQREEEVPGVCPAPTLQSVGQVSHWPAHLGASKGELGTSGVAVGHL